MPTRDVTYCMTLLSLCSFHCPGYVVFHALTSVGQPHYGQHLSPCDFRLFGILKKVLKGYRFWLGKVIKALVVQWSCGFSWLWSLDIVTKFVF